MRTFIVAATLAWFTTGCGGGGGGSEYTLAPTLSCLTAAGLNATEESATENPLGEPDIDVDYGDYEVYVVFAEDHDAAKRIAADVNRLSVSLGGGDDFASTKGRVAMYSSGEKTSAERQDQIEACLTE